jgi:oligoendopeptidase F
MATTELQERDRTRIEDKYKWNVDEVYPSIAAWRLEKDRIAGELPRIRTFAGKLTSSASFLADALEMMTNLEKELTRLYVYASMLADLDTRVSEAQGMRQEMQLLFSEYGAQAAYVEPELLKAGNTVVEALLKAEPRLQIYAFYLRDILRRAAHTLSDAEEKLLADAGPLAMSSGNIYGILSNADFPYPTITREDGRSTRVDQSGYGELRTSPVRKDRDAAMSAFFTALGQFSRTLGSVMDANIQRAVFYSKSRRYASTLEARLDGPNIPVSVYTRLVDGVNRNLSFLHRYLRLRKRMLGIEGDLHYYDLYAPLVASVDLKYTPEEAQKHVLASVAPLGSEYEAVVRRAFSERWIDFYPTDGKRSGAYSNGAAYDVHPYMLLNYLGQYNDVSTLAHELGHTMHSYHSNKAQPYALSSYHTFVAEVASTFNEALLLHHMLEEIKDVPTRISLLGNFLESIKSTVFRQTQLAEFELRMHEVAESGRPITGDMLAKLYLEITRRYYGHDQGITVVDDYVAHEWSYIPHFYHEFYVFQYATSITAAEALSARVLAGDRETTKRYLKFLGTGGSKYPIELLKDAGVDMTTDEPLEQTLQKMGRVMDEIEALLQA